MLDKEKQTDDNGFPDFEPVRFYDAPATLLTQLFDGESSFGTAVRTMISSESLSPTERDSYATRLKKSHGGNALTNTFIDIATNPLTWLLLMTSPVGAKEFMATGGKLFRGRAEMKAGSRHGVWEKSMGKITDLLRPLHLTSLMGQSETMVPNYIVQGMTSRVKYMRDDMLKTVGTERGTYFKKLRDLHGIEDFDPSRAKTPDQEALLRKANVIFHMDLSGNLKPRTITFRDAEFTRAGKFHPVDKTGIADTSTVVPHLLDESQYQMLEKLRQADQLQTIQIGGKNYQLNGAVLEAKDVPSLNKIREIFPSSVRKDIKYVTTKNRMSDSFSVDGFDEAAAHEWLKQNGILDEYKAYSTATKKYLSDAKHRLFGKLGPQGQVLSVFEMDPAKVLRIYQRAQRGRSASNNLQHTELEAWVLDSLMGVDTIDRMVPAYIRKAIRTGDKSVPIEDVYAVLKENLSDHLSGSYLPRNTHKLIRPGQNGVPYEINPTHTDALARGMTRDKSATDVSASLFPRTTEVMGYDPKDLQTIHSILSDVKGDPFANAAMVTMPVPGKTTGSIKTQKATLFKTIKQAQRSIATAKSQVRVSAMDGELAMRKYANDVTTSIVMHTIEAPRSIKQALIESMKFPGSELDNSQVAAGKTTSTSQRRFEYLGVDPQHMQFMNTRRDSGQYTAPGLLSENPYARGLKEQIVESEKEIARLNADLLANPQSKRIKKQILTETRKKNGFESDLDFIGSQETRPDVALMHDLDNTHLTYADAIDVMMGRENVETKEYFKNGIIPHMFGGAKPTQMFGLTQAQNARSLARKFASSDAGKWIESNGGYLGKNVVQNARVYGNLSGYEMDAARAQGGMAGYLYATHLGFNGVSAIWNLMQPLQWASTWMGGRDIMYGYGQAFKQIGSYLKERIPLGLRIDPTTQMELWNKHVPMSNYKGRDLIGSDLETLSNEDAYSFLRPPTGKSSMLHYALVEAPLKMFQLAERVNRITVAEGSMNWVRRMQKETGIRYAENQEIDFAQTMQSMVNFSSNPATQIRAFQEGGWLSNPFVKMFMQYPLRSISNIMASSQIGGGTREFGFQKFGGKGIDIPAVPADLMRLLGIGAVTYEIGKNMLGVDTSSGLAGAAVTQLPQQFLSGKYPVPPVVDIPMQFFHGLATGDKDELRQSIYRVLPFGIQLQKTVGALPAIPGGGRFGLLQSQYADWANPNSQGQIPIYKDDGTLQSFNSPLSLVLKGLGADFKKLNTPQEATKFLLANRAEMTGLRRQYKDAVLGNNMSAATQIEVEYRKRYGVPMTVKPGDWNAAIKIREVTLPERLLETLPSNARDPYQQTLSSMSNFMSLPEGALENQETATSRNSLRNFSSGLTRPELPADDVGN